MLCSLFVCGVRGVWDTFFDNGRKLRKYNERREQLERGNNDEKPELQRRPSA